MPDSILSVDIGSVTLAWIVLGLDGAVLQEGYAFHDGQVAPCLEAQLGQIDLERVGWLAATGSAAAGLEANAHYDGWLACIAAARELHPDLGGILTIGGERFGLITFDGNGDYRSTRGNSSCAAGTGSFLDEQARNLGFPGGAALSAAAERSTQPPPRIASRCAVFAKTDVTHAQQQGYSREAICDGLCLGLASTVADAVLSGRELRSPIVLAGGVALNAAVVRHLRSLTGRELVVDRRPHLCGAHGAALLLLREVRSGTAGPPRPRSAGELLARDSEERAYAYGPLDCALPGYPDFSTGDPHLFEPRTVRDAPPVEVETWRAPAPDSRFRAYLGVDIGSTSTKAVLLDPEREVAAGFYTRTTGRPLLAAQALLEAMEAWAPGGLDILGSATTGAGRKFVGSILGADLVVDEITAHAKAACTLDPEVDTILEIGGQDAKFTTLRDGMVTSAVMNTVCAAGTGSFIEEQARRLHVPLADIAALVGAARSPLASDRCTVFMQRDVNQLVAAGYSVPETLAAVLHSVRENYLAKVAQEGRIGRRICFQGATARNRALVAAFAMKLGRPIRVSRQCHLTGALGAALLLAEAPPAATRFRGTGLHRLDIPLGQETCELCPNHCRLTVALVEGRKSAYGFQCGRDYGVDHYVSRNASGFDLFQARRQESPAQGELHAGVTVGLLSGLQFFEDLGFWQAFFAELGVPTLTAPGRREQLAAGKKLEGAEFCAPMALLHAQAEELARRADVLFVPLVLTSAEHGADPSRQYCYYSQYAGSLIAGLEDGALGRRCIMPHLDPGLSGLQTWLNLYWALRPVLGERLKFSEVMAAHHHAGQARAARREALREVFRRETEGLDDVAAVLVGRPYVALSRALNMGIPDLFAALGVKTFFQDMLDYDAGAVEPIAELLKALHWHYASKLLEAAQVAAATPGLYPVLVTCFKCAPDACILDFFKKVCEGNGKPYLILQLDEHESAVGYETRIEAAVRAFRNHHGAHRDPDPEGIPAAGPVVSPLAGSLAGKTLLFPCWDRLTCSLLVANLQREGIDARLIRDTPGTLPQALARNAGQCIPLNLIAQNCVDSVRAWELDPARTVLWLMESRIACHLGMYPMAIQSLVAGYGGGFEQTRVYLGEISMLDVSIRAALDSYFCYMAGGNLRRMACRVRPYEREPGAADAAQEEGLRILETALREGAPLVDATVRTVELFARIPTAPRSRPKVAIFGDLYARDNEVLNQDLIRTIEANGGEVITTPYYEYIKTVAAQYFRRWLREGKYLSLLKSKSLLAAVQYLKRDCEEAFERVLGPASPEPQAQDAETILARFNLSTRHTGETFDNLLNLFRILEEHPDLDLFVHASPAFCCPSLVTEALSARIEEVTGVPVVSVTYDGTASCKNDVVIPYLKFPRSRRRGLSGHAQGLEQP